MLTIKPKCHTLSLQKRDIEVLRGLLESRVMTGGQIASIYFDGSKQAAKQRLHKLKATGYVGERARLPSEPAVLSLTKKGLMLLKERGVLADYPPASIKALEKRGRVSSITLRHELEIMDVKTAFHAAIKKADGFSIAEFTTWTQTHLFKAVPHKHNGKEVEVKPDGFIRIHETKDDETFEQTFFLEVDRSTEILDTLVAKAASYLDYYKSGGFAVRNGGRRSDVEKFPFRVLMVFKTPERRNNAAERMLEQIPPIRGLVLLTTLEEVLKDPLGKVWFRPSDYEEALKGTPYLKSDRQEQAGYQRQTARDLFVEKEVRKLRIHIEA